MEKEKSRRLSCRQSRDAEKGLGMSTSSKKTEEESNMTKVNYDYLDFTLDELALKAKTDSICMDEVLVRFSSLIYGMSRRYLTLHPFEDYNEVVIYLFYTIERAVRIFDEKRGSFDHLSRKMLGMSILHFASKRCQAMASDVRNFGIRVRDASTSTALMDSVSSKDQLKEDTALRIDIETFENYLNPQEKRIFLLYQYGFTYREIGKKMNLSHSYVGMIVNEILKDLMVWRDKELV